MGKKIEKESKLFIYLHFAPLLILSANSKKEAVVKVRKYFNDNEIYHFPDNISESVRNVTDATISRSLYYTKVNESFDSSLITFDTFTINKQRQYIEYFSYSLNENDIIVQQYKFIKRKNIINELLEK